MAFVIPIVGVGALGAAGAVALVRRWSRRTIAILGAPQTGKTSLLQVFRDGSVGEEIRPTITPTRGGIFALEVRGKRKQFEVTQDLPGSDGIGYPKWLNAFTQADHVVYLFRADRIVDRDPAESERVEKQLNMLTAWLAATKKKPQVLLLGTWSDHHSGFAEDRAGFTRAASSIQPISMGAWKLGAQVVVGSLSSAAEATTAVHGVSVFLK